MELRAAMTLCRQQAKACNVDREDLWKLHSDDFVKEAREVLDAVGAADLLRELQHAARWFDQLTAGDAQRYRVAMVRATGEAKHG